jgi:anti-sigma factor RsiW
MTHHDDDMLASYLGGELSDEQRRQFESTLADDPDLATHAAELKETLELLRSLPAAAPEPASPAPGRTMLRYAAVIALTFVVGYLVGGSRQGPVDPVDPARRADFETRLGDAYVKQTSDSGLTRTLLAIHAASARPSDPPPEPATDSP